VLHHLASCPIVRRGNEWRTTVQEFTAQLVGYASVDLPAHCGVEGTLQLVELAPVEGRNQGIRAFLPWALWLTRFIKWARRMARSEY
jgi:hypothetical protein